MSLARVDRYASAAIGILIDKKPIQNLGKVRDEFGRAYGRLVREGMIKSPGSSPHYQRDLFMRAMAFNTATEYRNSVLKGERPRDPLLRGIDMNALIRYAEMVAEEVRESGNGVGEELLKGLRIIPRKAMIEKSKKTSKPL